MNIIHSKNNTKSYTKSKQIESNMASNLIYDVKGKVDGVEKSYYDMSDDDIKELMEI